MPCLHLKLDTILYFATVIISEKNKIKFESAKIQRRMDMS